RTNNLALNTTLRGRRYSQKGAAAAISAGSVGQMVSRSPALPGLGRIAAAADCHEPSFGIRDIDIDDRDRAPGAPHGGGGGEARGRRGTEVIDPEIDR